jgi:isopenicillin N synthase-like dioxygenase
MITASRIGVVADDLLTRGYSRVALEGLEAGSLAEVFGQSRRFFDQDVSALDRYAGSSPNHGYRTLGAEYSISPDRPDQNDSFSLWADDTSLIPNREEIAPFLTSLSDWRAVLLPLATEIFAELGRRYDAPAPIVFQRSSYLQVNNYYPTPASIELLQDEHEDGHLLTFINTTAPGLEIRDGDFTPIETAPDEVLVMPGSLLTDLTGGQIPPLYHRVRNCLQPSRMSLMYFVNPQLDHELEPWLRNETNEGVSILDRARKLPNGFGLPDVPVL